MAIRGIIGAGPGDMFLSAGRVLRPPARVQDRVAAMNHSSPHSRRVLIVISLVFLAYGAIRMATATPVLEKPRILADTTAYTRISQVPRF